MKQKTQAWNIDNDGILSSNPAQEQKFKLLALNTFSEGKSRAQSNQDALNVCDNVL